MSKLNIVSFCDGGSTAQYVINRLTGGQVELNYNAFEMDPKCKLLVSHLYPKTKQYGDIRNWRLNRELVPKKVDLFFAGTSCKNTSMAGDRTGFATLTGEKVTSVEQYKDYVEKEIPMNESCICFWESIWFIREVKPTHFFFEIPLLKQEYLDIFIRETGVTPIMIDSALVSAQSRKRYYFPSWKVEQPQDLGITIDTIIPNAKAYSYHGTLNPKFGQPGEFKWGVKKYITRKDGKMNTLVTSWTSTNKVIFEDGTIRDITIEEGEQFMGYDAGHLNVLGLTKTDKQRILGNGWSVPVIEHLFKFIPTLEKYLVIKENTHTFTF